MNQGNFTLISHQRFGQSDLRRSYLKLPLELKSGPPKEKAVAPFFPDWDAHKGLKNCLDRAATAILSSRKRPKELKRADEGIIM